MNEGKTHHIGDDCQPPHERIGEDVLSKSDYKRVEVLKTSKWNKEELTPPTPPEWATAYTVGSSIYHEGWESFIRHVGCEDGHWLVLIEPVRRMNRAVRRREGRNA